MGKDQGPAEAPDEASAALTARLQNRRIEVLSQRTEFATVWANPDGTRSVEQSAGPLRFRAKGQWQDIDTRLVEGADGSLHPAAHPLDMRLAGPGEDQELVSLGEGSRRLALGWEGTLPKPVVTGDRAVYPSVRPGLDLALEVSRTGVEETFIAHNRKAVRELEQLDVPLRARGGKLKEGQDGQELVDGTGRVVATMGEATLWDNEFDKRSGDPEDVEEVDSQAKPTGDGVELSYDVSTAFLADADTKYPLTLDPAISFGPAFDAFVQQGYTTDQSRAEELKWGNNGSGQVARSYLGFDTGKVKGRQILSAKLSLFNHHSWSCQDRGWDVWWTGPAGTGARWTNQPRWISKFHSSTETRGPSPCNPGWISSDVTTLMRQFVGWKDNVRHYLGIQAANENDPYGWKRVSSAEGPRPPVLAVTYNTVPETPATPAVSPSRTDSVGTFIPTTTPTFSVTPRDADGGNLTVQWEVWEYGGKQPIVSGQSRGPAGRAQSWKVPAGHLKERGRYSIRARVWDGHAWSGWCSPWRQVYSVLTAPPGPPNLSSTDYPQNTWGGTSDGKGNFTGTINATPVSAFTRTVIWRVDNQPWRETPWKLTVPLNITVRPGAHTLQAKTRNASGLESAAASYSFLAGQGAALQSPGQGARSAKRTVLASRGSESDTAVRYQWRRGEADTWKDVPVEHVRLAQGGAAVAWPQSAPQGKPADLVWNISGTLGDNGSVQVRAVFTGGQANASRLTPEHDVTLDRDAGQAPSENIGPGAVNLLTGNFTLSDTDASVWDMTVTRTLASRRPSADLQHQGFAPVFGPGWLPGTVSDITESEFTAIRKTSSTSVEVNLADEDGIAGIAFNAAPGGTWQPEPGAEEYALAGSLTGNFTLTDSDGTVTTFTNAASGDTWQVATTYLPEANSATRQTYEKAVVGGRALVRPKYVIAPTSAVSQASCETAPATVGCRVLEYVYAPATTATAGTAGDVAGQVKEIRLWATNPGAKAAAPSTVSAYTYDSRSRLVQQWDPRITPAVITRYSYDDTGRVTAHQTGTDLPWTMVYGKIGTSPESGEGMLQLVRRAALKPGTRNETDGTGQTTVVYDVPLTGDNAPYSMGHEDVAAWNQSDAPTDATALFPADAVPASSDGTALAKEDYRRAVLTYVNASGRSVNTVNPAGGITTAQYDHYGNTVWQLTAVNRALALGQEPGSEERLDALELSTVAPGERADLLATVDTFSEDGQRNTDTRQPLRSSLIKGSPDPVPARTWTHREFDQNRPDNGSAKAQDLVTTETIGAELQGRPDEAVDVRTTSTTYDWTLGLPTATVDDPAGLALTSTTSYDSQGRIVKGTRPASNGHDAGTMLNRYWTATGSGECAGRPEWADLACSTRAASAADGGDERELPTSTTEYERHGHQSKVTDTANGATRTTVTTHDPAGRVVRTSVPTAFGTPLQDVITEYDRDTGRSIVQRFLSGAALRTDYDDLGRAIGYTDGHGAVTLTRYDNLDRPIEVSDPSGTRSYTYDLGVDPRGIPTAVTDSRSGTISGRYDLDGTLVEQQLPGDITVADTFDTTGDTGTRTVVRGRDEEAITLLADSQTSNAQGQWAARTAVDASHAYAYDQTGRLVQHDVRAGQDEPCTRTSYRLDRNSNRTARTLQAADAEEGCGAGVSAVQTSHYDSADRLQDRGYTYDAFGRTLTTGEGTRTSYYTDDVVREQTHGDHRTTWTLDPDGRRDTHIVETRTDGAWGNTNTVTDHFDGSGDEPLWSETGTTRTRYVEDLAGNLIATVTGTRTEWQLTDLHDDVVTAVTPAGEARVHAYDPFGIPAAGTPATPYGYLGGKQRSNETPSGHILMGVRLYNPTTGRFLQVDPVTGGSANDYDYAYGDPVNKRDLDGTICFIGRNPNGSCRGSRQVKSAGRWVNRNKMNIVAWGSMAIPGLGAVGMAYRAYRVVRVASATRKMDGGMRTTRTTSRVAGRIWTGRGSRKTAVGRISANRQRQWRAPSYKPGRKGWQSNFESRSRGKGAWKNNYHVNHRRPFFRIFRR
ncbi:DNRLRE domain-containing protein [Streptomyces sp. NBC_00237]|uniref:DNRLRE domain-containing protein n=1 Tax=Streptomyces sp. NBC_00237 TaxID=2975687 RepID=UPI002256270F|nr:DNRLRE domain-containing protein [Streptomyces sp. NBC_00237]MCX5205811.1 DNRLRE domain-containing protein [Streptomyces sp. NBC_00237]